MRQPRRPTPGPDVVLLIKVRRGQRDMMDIIRAHLDEFGAPHIDPRSHLILAIAEADGVVICTCPRDHVRRLFPGAPPECLAEIDALALDPLPDSLALGPLPQGAFRAMTFGDDELDEFAVAADFSPLVTIHA
jgi:hypothetical protein